MQLQQGEKRSLTEIGAGLQCTVRIDFGLMDADIAAFGLNRAKAIGDDRYVVLFSNPRAPDGAIALTSSPDSATFDLDLARLPQAIDRIVFTATHDSQPIARARPLVVTLDNGKATFDVARYLTGEKAVMLLEIYRHAGGWKVGAIAAGFAGGLAALISHFGGEVADVAAFAPPPPTQPPPPVSLRKITLEKSSPAVSLKKTGAAFGEIRLNLNWNQGGGRRGLFGGPKAIDLDLGVLIELQNGERGVIQALGGSFGNYDAAPWVELSGDDRTGAGSLGETIRVNGRHFDQIARLAVFALIYDGVPNWLATDGVVRMEIPGQPEIEVRMDEGRNESRLCGIALIENKGGELQIERHMQYYKDQKHFADSIGIHLRWAHGTKD